MKNTKFLLVAAALALPTTGHALTAQSNLQILGYGALADAATFGDCPSFCRVSDATYEQVTDGGAGATSAAAEEDSFGYARSAAFFEGMYEAPILKAEGSSGLGASGDGFAFAGNGYTNISGGALTIGLDYILTGTTSTSSSGYSYAAITANFAVFMTDDLEFYPHFGTLAGEIAADSMVYNDSMSENGDSGSYSFELADGDSFFVVGSLFAVGQNGVADAYNTLNSSITATPVNGGGTPNTPAVPLPASVWLLGAALGGTGLMRKRKSKA